MKEIILMSLLSATGLVSNGQNPSQESTWPVSNFFFQVDFGDGLSAMFKEVTGLDNQSGLEYRKGSNPDSLISRNLPKLNKVFLKKGIFTNNNKFNEWKEKVIQETIGINTVTISLLDEKGNPTMKWKLTKAWPSKITGTYLKADDNEVTVETIELTCEEITVEEIPQK